MTRVLTGLVLAPIIVYVVLWAPLPAFLAVLLAVAILCFWEYSAILARYGMDRFGPLGYAAGIILILLPFPQQRFLVVVLTAVAALCLSLSASELAKAWPRAAALVMGVLYVFGTWRFAVDLHDRNPHWLLFALALNWVGDTFAYYTGRAFGRHRLAPAISPAKSWEGSAGSLAGSLLFGLIYSRALLPAAFPLEALVVASVGNVAGQIGDLAESALKRGAGVKDSGTLLPGHGGWLDRADSTLFALPVVHAILTLW